ncbi:NUDIX hydrolase [Stackebrandtia soli]|uniref:NUDIX hydrolase n=1 Tax=Stackebrandtia soli TaxID=1892856 RepID=UPI0039E8C09A
MNAVEHRRASRVLLLDESDRILLFRGCDPRKPEEKYWFSVGGGVNPGETDADAAVRELREETGLVATVEDLVGPVFTEVSEFDFDGRHLRQENVYFVFRVNDPVIETSGFEAYEVDTMDRHTWWSLSELRATSEVFYPRVLVSLLSEIVCRPH